MKIYTYRKYYKLNWVSSFSVGHSLNWNVQKLVYLYSLQRLRAHIGWDEDLKCTGFSNKIKLVLWVEFDLWLQNTARHLDYSKNFVFENTYRRKRVRIFPTFIKLIAMMFNPKWIYLFICFFFSFLLFCQTFSARKYGIKTSNALPISLNFKTNEKTFRPNMCSRSREQKMLPHIRRSSFRWQVILMHNGNQVVWLYVRVECRRCTGIPFRFLLKQNNRIHWMHFNHFRT